MKKKPVVIKDLLQFKFPENLQYSPDGKLLAFHVAQANEKKNSYNRDIWLVKDKQAKPFTTNGNTSLVIWDNETTMLVTKPNDEDIPGTTPLYKLSTEGGEAEKWITLPFPLMKLFKVDENHYVALGSIDMNDPDAYKDKEEDRKKKLEEIKKNADYEVIDEVPYWFNGIGYINKKRTALFEIKTGKTLDIKRITAKNFNAQSVAVEGKKVYYVGNTKERKENFFDKIYVYHTNTKKNEVLYGKNDYSIRNIFVLKGQVYVLASSMKEYGLNQTPDFMKVTKKGLEFMVDPHRQLHSGITGDTALGGGKQNVVVSNALYTIATDDDHTAIWKYTSSLKKSVVLDEGDAVLFMDVTKDRIAFVKETEAKLCEVYETDLNGKKVEQLTDLNTAYLKDHYVAKPNVVHYTSGKEKLHGWVLLPQNFNKNKKYPAILDIHGGPRAIYGKHFFHEMQVWASKGYVVMFTNIRGSDGRDDEFADIRGKYGDVDFRNLMDFVDTVLKKYPNINQKKLCETGGSYGGFMTNWIITHTNRFCCAVSQRSISNWISFTFVSDIGLHFGPDQCGAKGLFGKENFDKLWDHSPLKYAKGVKTPTLFIHSDEDYRCPLPEGMQMMQALAAQNIDTKLVMFRGENHELSRSGKPLHRIRRLEEITNWFEKYTK